MGGAAALRESTRRRQPHVATSRGERDRIIETVAAGPTRVRGARRSISMSRLTAALDDFPWLKTAREVALFAYRRGREVRLQQVAGSLTFTTVLSIVPLFAVALALFSVFPLFAEFREAFQSLVQRTLPAQISSTVLRYLGEFAQQATRLTAAGLIFLGLTALAMIMTVDRVLNDIWQVRERRPFSQRVLIYWAHHHAGADPDRRQPDCEFVSLVAVGGRDHAHAGMAAQPDRLRPGRPQRLRLRGAVCVRAESHGALARCTDRRLCGRHPRGTAEVGFAHFIGRGAVRSIYGAFAALAALPVVDVPVLVRAAVRRGHRGHTAAAARDALLGRTAGRQCLRDGAGADPAVARCATRGSAAVGVAANWRAARAPIRPTPSGCSKRSNGSATCAGCPRRGAAVESSEWILTCEPATRHCGPAFERFAVDTGEYLLSLDREGVGAVLQDWIERDDWINAPLERSLPPVPRRSRCPRRQQCCDTVKCAGAWRGWCCWSAPSR